MVVYKTFSEWWESVGQESFEYNGMVYVSDLKDVWDMATLAATTKTTAESRPPDFDRPYQGRNE